VGIRAYKFACSVVRGSFRFVLRVELPMPSRARRAAIVRAAYLAVLEKMGFPSRHPVIVAVLFIIALIVAFLGF